jgi:sphingosine kinase
MFVNSYYDYDIDDTFIHDYNHNFVEMRDVFIHIKIDLLKTETCALRSSTMVVRVTYKGSRYDLIVESSIGLRRDNKIVHSFPTEQVFAVHCKGTKMQLCLMVDTKTGRITVNELEFDDEDSCTKFGCILRKVVFGIPEDKKLVDRKLLIILNPFAGVKKAKQLFESQVKPILEYAHLSYDVVITERPYHATEIAKNVDFTKIDEIITMGGDGTLNEVLQGILSRKDWSTAIKHPLGLIPCGTGNGLSAACGFSGVPDAAMAIARGFYKPLDIMSVFQNGQRRYSFLSLTWGLIADVDIGSEFMRCLGDTRFPIQTIRLLLFPRYYSGKFSFIEEKGNPVKEVKSCFDEIDFPSNTPSYLDGPDCPYLMANFEKELKKFSKSEDIKGDPKYTKPVKSLSSKFHLFLASNTPAISTDVQPTPRANMNDGTYDVILIRDKTTRMFSIGMFSKLSEKDIVAPLEYYKVKAFSLEPIDKGSWMVVDGEAVDYSPVLCEVHQGLANIITK